MAQKKEFDFTSEVYVHLQVVTQFVAYYPGGTQAGGGAKEGRIP